MSNKTHIFLVEDNHITALLTTKLLEKTGKADKISVCKNGKEAYDTLIDLIEKGEPMPDLLLLDLVMPVWDGWFFLEKFSELKEREEVKIYILTSSISSEDVEKAEAWGLKDNYLVKPVSFSKLNEILDSLKGLS